MMWWWPVKPQRNTSTTSASYSNDCAAKGTKAKLFRTSCDFLGHVIGADGVAPQEKKVEAVSNWPTPSSVSDIKAFLGLAGYYRKFIHRFSALATPLNALLKDTQSGNGNPTKKEPLFNS
jgi:hypothetical protein